MKKRTWLAKGYGSLQSAWRTWNPIPLFHWNLYSRVGIFPDFIILVDLFDQSCSDLQYYSLARRRIASESENAVHENIVGRVNSSAQAGDSALRQPSPQSS